MLLAPNIIPKKFQILILKFNAGHSKYEIWFGNTFFYRKNEAAVQELLMLKRKFIRRNIFNIEV